MSNAFPTAARKRAVEVLVIGLLSAHAGLLGYGAWVHSPTNNEPAHLVAGLSYWKFGRFGVYNVNPPLVRLVAASPVLWTGCETDWRAYHDGVGARPEMRLGAAFCKANGARTVWLVTLARWACVPFSLFGGYVCFLWARDLYGAGVGLLSLALWCFCPNVLAYGQLITSDTAATSLGVAASYAFWRWLKRPMWRATFASGFLLGLAELAKTTLVVFFLVWPLLWVVYRWSDRKRLGFWGWAGEGLQLAARFLVTLTVINLGYGFEGSFSRLGGFSFVSQSLGGPATLASPRPAGGNVFAETWLADVPVPLPKNYVTGIDLQRRDFEAYHHPFFLSGVWSETGWWYYYLYALAIKVPLGTWLLVLLAAAGCVTNRGSAEVRDELCLLTPGFLILTFVSLQTGINEHMRYVLPAFPFAYVFAGRAAVFAWDGRRAWRQIAVGAGLGWSVGSSLWYYPHSLSYFNEVVGGPRGGANHLVSSNIDYGQDLLYLRAWYEANPEWRPLSLAYYGPMDPELLGMAFRDIKTGLPSPTVEGLPRGFYAVSVNLLKGYERVGRLGDFSALDRVEPVRTIGYSIYLYDLR